MFYFLDEIDNVWSRIPTNMVVTCWDNGRKVCLLNSDAFQMLNDPYIIAWHEAIGIR